MECVIATGTCHAVFAYEVGHLIDLEGAERRLAAVAERQKVKQKRRAPAYFEYRPAPLRVTQEAASCDVGAYRTAGSVEVVLYDFGAVSVSFGIPIAGPLAGLPALSQVLYGNEQLAAASRRQVEQVLATLGDAVVRPRLADFVEDYSIFAIREFTEPVEAAALSKEHAPTVAQILRAEPRPLSQEEIADAMATRVSYGPRDATFIDADAALVFDPEGEDVEAVLEFANTQLLEMRFLDQQLDDLLDAAYGMLARRGAGRGPPPGLERVIELQVDAAMLFEQVTNALKLIGEQYLTRVYGLVSRRFHLAEWDHSITRKLETLESIYSKLTDRAAARRMELLEWIIILLIALSIVIAFLPLRHG